MEYMSTTLIAPRISVHPWVRRSNCKSQPSICKCNPNLRLMILHHNHNKKGSCLVAGSQRLGFIITSDGQKPWNDHNHTRSKRDLIVCSNVQPGPPTPSEMPLNSWNGWILGIAAVVALPFLTNKWGALFNLTKEAEAATEAADSIAEVVEKAAEVVEKAAEEIAADLPQGGKLKNAVEFVENFAREAAKDANLVDEFIDQVEEVEKKVENFMQQDKDQANETAKRANDKQK